MKTRQVTNMVKTKRPVAVAACAPAPSPGFQVGLGPARAGLARVLAMLGALLPLLVCIATQAADLIWTNAAGGNWNVAANWSPNQVPAAGDNLFITNDGTYRVTLNVSATVNTLTLGGQTGTQTLTNSGATLTLTNVGTVGPHGVLGMSGGTLAGGGSLTISGSFIWTGGTLSGTGVRTIAPGGVLHITGAATKSLTGGTLVNASAATWDAGTINVGGTVLSNAPGATFDIAADVSLGNAASVITVRNAGLWRKTGGSGVSTLIDTFHNDGTVEVQAGTLRLTGGGTSTGTFLIASGAALDFGGGTHNLNSGSSLSGAGTLQVSGGTVNWAGGFSGTGPVVLTGGTFSPTNAAEITMASLVVGGGTLGGSSPVSVTGATLWTNGGFDGLGLTHFHGGLSISGAATKTIRGRTLVNRAQATWSAGTLDVGSRAGTVSVISNAPGATLDITADVSFIDGSGGITTANAGLLRKTGGSGVTTLNDTFNNSGTVEIQSGTLRFVFAGSGTHTGNFVLSPGATLEYAGADHTLANGSSVTGGALVLNAGSLTVESNAPVVVSNLVVNAGDLVGGSVVVNGLMTWTGGTLSGAGVLQANGGLVITGATTKVLTTRTLVNTAQATWSEGAIRVGFGYVISNAPGATFDLTGDVSYDDWTQAGLTANAGVWRKTGGTGASVLLDTFQNTGTVEVRSGALVFPGVYTQTAGETLLAGGAITNSSPLRIHGGTLAGTNVIAGSVTNSATVSPGASPGQLVITGNYTQTTNGVLEIEVGGTQPGTQHDQLVVGGTARLAGRLRVTTTDGFQPATNEWFTALTAGTRVNQFSNVVTQPGASVEVSYDAASAAIRFLKFGLGLMPGMVPLNPGETQTFTSYGGSLPHSFSLAVNHSGGSIHPVTGLYTAGPIDGVVDTVRVSDTEGNVAHAFVVIGTPGEHFIVVTTTAPRGPGSLDAALLEANSVTTASRVRILFNIPGEPPFRITPEGYLPAFERPIFLDATSQPGYAGQPVVELDGTKTTAMFGPVARGLTLNNSNCIVRGLAINRFRGGGLFVLGTGGNVFEGNFIGTDVSGMVAPGATGPSGSTHQGAGFIMSSPNNRIGGATAAERNLISGNQSVGIVCDGNASNTLILGNWIGPNATGTAPLGAQVEGVRLGCANAVVSGNTIAFNAAAGVIMGFNVGNSIRGNSIHANGQLGIGFGAFPGTVPPNDPGDADEGPNGLQNFPILQAVRNPGSSPRLLGSLNSKPNAAFILDFYASAACDPSGQGEGQRYLGATTVTTDAAGNAAFDFPLPEHSTVSLGEVVTATATASDDGTSGFSPCVSVASSSIAGEVRNGSVGLAGVTITLSNTVTGTLLATRLTDAQGAFRFDFLPANGSYVVTPHRADFSFTPGSTVFNGLASEGFAVFGFTSLSPAGTLRGRVSTADGQPVAGVTIRVTDLLDPPGTDRQTETGADGIYGLAGLPTDRTLRVTPSRRSATFSPTVRLVSLAAGSETASFLLGSAHHIAGRIEVVSGPPALFSVTILDAAGRVVDRVCTDANGDYVSNPLPAGGRYHVRPRNTAYGFRPDARVVSELVADVNGVNFSAAQETQTIRGRVLNSVGGGISGATVIVTRPDLPTFSLRTNTAVDGSFEFGGIPDWLDYIVNMPPLPANPFEDIFRMLYPDSAKVTVDGAPPDEVTFTEVVYRRLSGQVLAEDHAPIANARLELRDRGSGVVLAVTETRPDGSFVKEFPTDRDLRIVPVNVVGQPAFVFTPEDATADRGTNALIFAFTGRRAPVVRGAIQTRDGFRLPQVTMALDGFPPVSDLTYDREGYSVALKSGEHYILVPKRANFRFVPEQVEFDLGSTDRTFDFTGRPLLPLRGRIAFKVAFAENHFAIMNADGSAPVLVPRTLHPPSGAEADGEQYCEFSDFGFDLLCSDPVTDGYLPVNEADLLETITSLPALSPDGRTLAYWTGYSLSPTMAANPSGTLQTVAANAFSPSVLIAHEVVGRPAWSPDGTHLAFARQAQDGTGLYVARATGGPIALIPGTGPGDRDPTWSPDGMRVAFVREFNGNLDIFVVHTDGTGLQQITTDQADDVDPAWSPDGSRVAFASNRDGNFEIYVMETSGRNPVRRTFHAADDRAPAWSPDGTMLAFERRGALGIGSDRILAMLEDGTLETELGSGSGPSWANAPAVATPAGSEVVVAEGAVSLTFESVTRGGQTTILPVDNADAPSLPPGYFSIPGAAQAFDIATTAGFTPPITVCFTLTGYDDPESFAALRILHEENGALVDRTILSGPEAPHYASRRLCARVGSLSPLHFAHALDPAQAIIQGTVVDASGKPVPLARLRLGSTSIREVLTDTAGHFVFGNLPQGADYTLYPDDTRFVFSPGIEQFDALSGTNVVNFVASPVSPPLLTITLQRSDSEQLNLSWPVRFPLYSVETTASLNPAHWEPLPLAPMVISNQYVVGIPLTNGTRFFRLKGP